MMFLSDFVINLMRDWQIEDVPINVLIGDKYYDIDSLYFDNEICEYMMKISGPVDYDTRATLICIERGDE